MTYKNKTLSEIIEIMDKGFSVNQATNVLLVTELKQINERLSNLDEIQNELSGISQTIDLVFSK